MIQASLTCKARSSWPGGNGRAMPGATAMLTGRIARSSRALLLRLLRILGTVCLAPRGHSQLCCRRQYQAHCISSG